MSLLFNWLAVRRSDYLIFFFSFKIVKRSCKCWFDICIIHCVLGADILEDGTSHVEHGLRTWSFLFYIYKFNHPTIDCIQDIFNAIFNSRIKEAAFWILFSFEFLFFIRFILSQNFNFIQLLFSFCFIRLCCASWFTATSLPDRRYHRNW